METASRFRTALRAAADAAGMVLDDAQVALAWSHAEILAQWNAAAGLTTLSEPEDVALRHFLESLLVATLIPSSVPPLERTLLDVGSGGGFPGLALRIQRPELAVTLLEPRERKAAFLRAASRLYPPPATRTLTTRLEDLPETEAWSVITLRGVNVHLDALERVLAPSGIVILAGVAGHPLASELPSAGYAEAGTVAIPGRRGTIRAWQRPPTR